MGLREQMAGDIERRDTIEALAEFFEEEFHAHEVEYYRATGAEYLAVCAAGRILRHFGENPHEHYDGAPDGSGYRDVWQRAAEVMAEKVLA